MTKYPTPYPELNVILDELVSRGRVILGENLVGAYLQGSFATGGFDEHSDADFIIVISEELKDETVDKLQELHQEIYEINIPWAQYLEGSYFPQNLLRAPFNTDQDLWYIDNGSRFLERSTHDNTLVVRSILREYKVTILGPDPLEIIDPVDVEALRNEIRKVTIDWGNEIKKEPDIIGSHFYQSFAVLHFCRAFHDLQAGSINSKRVGTEWTKRHIDSRWKDLIDRSWSGRPKPELSSRRDADPEEFQQTIEFVDYMMEQITRP